VVESPAAGPLKIGRSIIERIAFAQGRTMLLESNFASGRMAPWTAKEGGGWTVTDGALQCTTHGHRKGVVAEFDQDEAVTFEAEVEATEGRYINCELIIFADQSEHTYGHTSVIARFYSSQFYLMYAHNGGTNSVINRSVGNVMRKGLLRLAYDPETAKARVWLDSRDLGEYTIPKKITEGKFVLFNSRYSCKVTRLRVIRGIVPPSSAEEKTDAEAHVVRFANKDRVAAKQVTLADGKVALQTSFGDIAAPVGKVQSIAFRSEDLQEPRRRKDDIRVEAAGSRITVQFERLTPDHLIGRSKHAGDVKIKRDTIKRIHFNIYR
jgi:hypothetical protein